MINRIKTEVKKMFNRVKGGIFQVFTANVVNKLIVMISNMVITRILTKQEYGTWGFVLNIYSYASLITGLGLASGAFQFGAENKGKDKANEYFRYSLSTGLIINAIISLGFIFSSLFNVYSIPEAQTYIRFYVPVILLEYIIEILLTILRCQGRMKEYAKVLNLNTFLVSCFTCVGAAWGVGGVIAGKYIAAFISVAYIVLITRNEITKILKSAALKKREKREIWHFSLLNGVSSTLNRILYLIDVSMIASLLKDAVDIANYKVATLIPNSLTFIPSSIIIVVLPDIIANNNNNPWLKKNIKKTYIWLFILNLAIGALLVIFAPLIISIISGSQYIESVYPFRVLVLGYVISGTFRHLSTNILAGLRKVGFNLISSIATGLADIALNYYFIIEFGMIGAAYATFLVETLASVISFGFVIYVLKKRNNEHFMEKDQ